MTHMLSQYGRIPFFSAAWLVFCHHQKVQSFSKFQLGDKSMLSAVHTTITSFCSLIFNVTSLITLYARTQSIKNNSKLPKKGEINLLILSCIDFILDCLSEAHQV